MNEDKLQTGMVSLFLRSLIFWILFALLNLIFFIPLVLSFPFPLEKRFLLTSTWSKLLLWSLQLTCNLRYEIRGTENIPDTPGIVFSKHQSTWETLSLNLWFKTQTWVVKRELLWVPVFGWGVYMMDPIALNRGAGKRAIDQLIQQGRERLVKGRWIIIFPEGTRIEPGKTGRYRIGGAKLAEGTGYPVTPVAHNAGEYWPRRKFIKRPGVIQVRIGPPISTRNKSAQQILGEARQWIETEMAAITTLKQHQYGANDSETSS